eukprot:403336468
MLVDDQAQTFLIQPKADFTKNSENHKIAEVRYQNYLNRYSATMKSVYDERRVLLNKPQTASMMMSASIMPFGYNGGSASMLSMRRTSPKVNLMSKTLNNNNFSIISDNRDQMTHTASLPNINVKKQNRAVFSISPVRANFNDPQQSMLEGIHSYNPQVYFKIASEYQKMNEDQMKNQLELKNYLMTKRQNEQRIAKLEEKLSKIEKQDKESRKELKEKFEVKEHKRLQKLKKVNQEFESQEIHLQVERENFNKDRLKKLLKDQLKEKELSKQIKSKLDKEINLKQIHTMKREELNQKEIDTCLNKLHEINNKIVKSNQIQIEKKEERTAFLKTQALLFEMKKEQMKKLVNEDEDKKYEKFVLKMAQLEEKRTKQQKDIAKQQKMKIIHDKQKMEKVLTSHQEYMKQKNQYLKKVEEKATQSLNITSNMKRNHSVSTSLGFKGLLSPQSKPPKISQIFDEEFVVKKEMRDLKTVNLKENLEREQKKKEFKKLAILEKEQMYSQKIQQMKLEKAMIDKCKVEQQNHALKNKESRMQAILKLKDFSIVTGDKKQKMKAKKLAEQLAKDIDFEEVFKEEPKKKNLEDALQ